jgi:DMSO/TMAO reductase YedYZ heme-binding membrane subunit
VFKEGSRLYKLETILASVSALLGVVTLFWHDWLEVTGWDPDNHSGTAEWFIAIGLLVLALVLGALARREYRRGLPAAA